ncbi:MAG: acetamidase/formamidase family protein [Chloroflexi bacterium]|nr:acetamidase/formamidase family protein [Chloroflexota bacterium]
MCGGSTLYLPVFVPGALLALGDCHAVVGDGAVAGTRAECSAEIQMRVTVETRTRG